MGEGAVWKAVAAFGGALVAGGVAALTFAPELARILIVGGCAVFLLGLALYWHERWTWTRRPRLSRGMRCSHYPARYHPGADYPHAQELAITITKALYPPDFRVYCNASILAMEGSITEFAHVATDRLATIIQRDMTRYHSGIVAVSTNFSPLEPIDPPASFHLVVASDQPIRVLRIRHLRTKYPTTGGSKAKDRPAGTQQDPAG